jgi:hypothetical protein
MLAWLRRTVVAMPEATSQSPSAASPNDTTASPTNTADHPGSVLTRASSAWTIAVTTTATTAMSQPLTVPRRVVVVRMGVVTRSSGPRGR